MRFSAIVLFAVAMALAIPAGAKGGSSSRSGSRPTYGGSKHTTSHGGTYQGGSGTSHKGGTYKNPRSNDRYGEHKGTAAPKK